MQINGNGNVGIGTASPGAMLHIDSATNTRIRLEDDGTTGFGGTEFYDGVTYNGLMGWDRTNDNLIFLTRNNSSVPKMVIENLGNVGIGTTTPGSILHVEGSDTSGPDGILSVKNTNAAGSGAPAAYFESAGNTAYGVLTLKHTGSYTGISTSLWIDNDNTGGGIARFSSGGSDRMYIAGGGNVGIGTTAPGSILEVKPAANNGVRIHNSALVNGEYTSLALGKSSAANEAFFLVGTYHATDASRKLTIGTSESWGGTENLVLTGEGKVGIGATSPTEKLTVAGHVAPDTDGVYTSGTSGLKWSAVWATNGTIQTSDRRLKENIEDSPYGLDEVMDMRPVSYTWIDRPDQGRKIGLIAQEMQPIVSEVVQVGDDERNTLGLNYSDIVPVLIKAIQEQQEIIEQQHQRLEQHEAGESGSAELTQVKVELSELRSEKETLAQDNDELRMHLDALTTAVRSLEESQLKLAAR